MNYVLFASYGNDSIALIQWAHENGLNGVVVLYSNTGWAIEWWRERVERAERFVRSLGYEAVTTRSEGFSQLMKRKKMFSRPQVQFCTEDLKIRPAMAWLDESDPDRKAICFVGVRREESRRRATYPGWVQESPAHGMRPCYAPLLYYTEKQRDSLITRAGFEVLPHRSKECFPCVNSNREDLRMLGEYPKRVARIDRLEMALGPTARGDKKTLFRPPRYGGAVGIREVVRWAQSERGKYDKDADADAGNCDAGFCGT